MNQRNLTLTSLVVALALTPALTAADGNDASGQWNPMPYHEPVAASIEPARSLYASRLTPPEPGQERKSGYQVIVEIAFDEAGKAGELKIHASDDNTPGEMLNQIALQLARSVRPQPRLKDGQPVRFTARVPYFFPVEDDEGPQANLSPQPRLLHSQAPQFPDLLAHQGQNGGAILELTISETGTVTKAKVMSVSHEVCGDAAVAAVKNWTFAPAEKNGRPVKSRWRIAVAFEAGREPGELKWRLAPRPSLGFYTVRLSQPGG